MLPRIEASLGQPGVSALQYAYLFDRVAVQDNTSQRYGTQGSCSADGPWTVSPVESPEQLNDRRAAVGLGTMEDYIRDFGAAMCG